VAPDEATNRVAAIVSRDAQPLRSQLLFQLGFLASAAVLLTGITTLLLTVFGIERSGGALIVLWVGSSVLFVLFGAWLVGRLVLQPMEQLALEADVLEQGAEPAGPAQYESVEFARLAERYRRMAANLLDVQAQVVRVEKLAGLGTLAAGVAHEVRNPLGALANYVEVLDRRAPGPADPAILTAMRGEIERIDRTIRSLLEYARPGAVTGVSDLNALVRDTLEFLGAQGAFKGVGIRRELDDRADPVRGSRNILEQVVVNLVLNARDAAPTGQIVIGTRAAPYATDGVIVRRADEARGGSGRLVTPKSPRRQIPAGTPGVVLYVADTGPGVPEPLRERVFDPFFTTKGPSDGCGLGLAIVARNVYEAGGAVWVDRAREGGAVFKVFLPLAEA
jgi:signal transduction histidine kinase